MKLKNKEPTAITGAQIQTSLNETIQKLANEVQTLSRNADMLLAKLNNTGEEGETKEQCIENMAPRNAVEFTLANVIDTGCKLNAIHLHIFGSN